MPVLLTESKLPYENYGKTKPDEANQNTEVFLEMLLTVPSVTLEHDND